MSKSMSHQKDAVRSGYWPLYRFHPSDDADGTPFHLDSKPPTMRVADFAAVGGPLRRARTVATPNGPASWRRCCRPTSTSAGTTTRRWPEWSARSPTWPPAGHARARGRRCPRLGTGRSDRPDRATPTTRRTTSHERRPAHALPGARPELAGRGLRQPVERARGLGPRRRRRRGRRHRDAVAVRGGGPPRAGRPPRRPGGRCRPRPRVARLLPRLRRAAHAWPTATCAASRP